MAIQPRKDMVGRESEWDRLTDFAKSGEASASLGNRLGSPSNREVLPPAGPL